MDLATRILVVDDDKGIRTLISSFLQKHGYECSVAGDAMQMREMLARQRHDLIVLDVMMPGEDGLSALRRLQQDDSTPVIMLSAVGSDIDRIIGLEVGAEDYLSKPCNPRELLARIRTVLRRRARGVDDRTPAARHTPEPQNALRFAGWALDLDAFQLHAPDGSLAPVSEGEFRLLRAFAEHPRRVLTRDQLLDYSHGSEVESYDRAIDVQVSRLRRKLASHADGADLIRTVRNEGYIFTADVAKP